MFYDNLIGAKQTNKLKSIVLDIFDEGVKTEEDDANLKLNTGKVCYNFNVCDGSLKNGYGFKRLQMPQDKNINNPEEIIETAGNEILALWSYKCYDEVSQNKYYVMYYNDSNEIGFANLFIRYQTIFTEPTHFTTTPTGTSCRIEDQDAMIFSSSIDGLFVMTNTLVHFYGLAPKLISCCEYADKIFAITSHPESSLVFSDNNNVTQWLEDDLEKIYFSDPRGGLTKVLTFNDYLYIFREFGITRLSVYSNDNKLAIDHLYQSDSYIYPGSIASSGDQIYFLQRSGIFSFNGSSVKKVELDCSNLLTDIDNVNCSGVCFNGKYYLACRINFDDDKQVGCETGDFVNNALFVLNLEDKKVEIMRGVDTRQLCVLNNPYLSKVVGCFRGENKAFIGEMTTDGKFFGETLDKEWVSPLTTSGDDSLKRACQLSLKTLCDIEVTITSDRHNKTYKFSGKNSIQHKRINVLGREFKISIKCSQNESISVSNAKITFSVIDENI